MPRAPQRCGVKRCTNKASFKGYCDIHKPKRDVWKKTSPPRDFLKTKEWLLQRRRVLYRDNTFNGGCQLRLPNCTFYATQVDHKTPVWYTGVEQVTDEELEGVCSSCHQKKSSFEGVQAKRIKKYLKERNG